MIAKSLVAMVLLMQSWIVDTIHERAAHYGVSGVYLERVARCESTLNPYAVGAAGELGIFQLHPRGLLPLFHQRGGYDPINVWEASDFAAWAFSRGLASHWTCAR